VNARWIKRLTLGVAVAVLLAFVAVSGKVLAAGLFDQVNGKVIPEVLVGDHYLIGATRSGGESVKTSNYTLDRSDDLLRFNSSGGAILVTLPADPAAHAGKVWSGLLVTAGNAVSFTPGASGKLDNVQGAYAGMDAVGDAVTIYCDGSNYFFLNRYIH